MMFKALTNTLKEAAQKLVKRGNLDGIHGLLDQIKQLDSKNIQMHLILNY